MRRYLLIILSAYLLTGCFTIENRHTGIPPGTWRGTLDVNPILGGPPVASLEDQQFNYDDTPPNYLPFNFDIIYENEKDFYVELINGEERIPVKEVSFGRDKVTNRDTFLIEFPIYDTYIKGIYNERVMQGNWVVNYKNNYSVPFVAKYGKNYRFTQLKEEPVINVSGKWAVEFTDADGTYPGVGVFKQNGNDLTGTFLTETGDYRYLEGTIQKNKLFLSVFDGSHAFLFEAKILEDQTMIGSFKSGRHYQATWSGKKDDTATLADPNTLTYLKEGYDQIDFAFPNEEGVVITFGDKRYQNKAKLVQIFGTWCPNCKDETQFLVDYLKKNPSKDLEVIGLAFEQYKDADKSLAAIKRYKQRMNIPYELLLAGGANKQEAAKALPMLNHILAYPTLLFIDKQNKIRKIHTGFSGPATEEYESFGKEFEATIAELVTSKK